MTRNVYFSHGTKNEQYLLEDIILESISIYGTDFYYVPRSLVAKDEILGEDRLSHFKTAYPIEMYLETVDGFEGQGAFIQKFGLMMEQSATLTVARRRWEQLVGRYGQTQLPNRPCEGDLLYFPLTNGLFEIKFVQHQDPFYQLGKLYVYKLQVELFQYASERIDTGLKEIDVFESLKSFDVTNAIASKVYKVNVTNGGSGYTNPPIVKFESESGWGATANAVLGTGNDAGKVIAINVTSAGGGYTSAPTVTFTSMGGGSGATAVAVIEENVDVPHSYGDNNKFLDEKEGIVFNTNNPFGDV